MSGDTSMVAGNQAVHKMLLRLDEATIEEPVRSQIATNNSLLQRLDGELFSFGFNAGVFTHIVLLLGQDTTRFGYNLELYLSSAELILRRTAMNGFLQIPAGSQDFRKRASEDLGVAVSALFMSQSFGLSWTTIAQIPANKKISKRTPDFVGYTAANERMLFEAKGTSRPESVDKAMNEALSQVKLYPDPHALRRFAVVSFLPGSGKSFPAFAFVADPPTAHPEFLPNDRHGSVLLHYEAVFVFAGLEQTAHEYRKVLSKVLYDQKESSSWGNPFQTVEETLRHERIAAVAREIGNYSYLGRTIEIKVGTLQFRAYFGVLQDVITAVAAGSVPEKDAPQFVDATDNTFVSQLSDGTVFQLEAANVVTSKASD